MSIEIVLIPVAIAAVSAWQAKREKDSQGREVVAVSTRMKNAGLLADALRDLDAEVDVQATVITATWASASASFSRDAEGVWTARFGGDVDSQQAVTLVQDLDRAYGLRVQQAVLERVRSQAPQAGMAVESETVEEDRSVTLVLNMGR